MSINIVTVSGRRSEDDESSRPWRGGPRMCGNGDRKGLASPAGLWRAFPARVQPLWVPARQSREGEGLPASAPRLWVAGCAGTTRRGGGPSGLLAARERRGVGTAPLGCWIRRNDARGGGQERWGEGVRFHPTRAREEVSRPSLIHLWISQQGERRIWARTVTSWLSRTILPSWARWHSSTLR